MTKLMNKIGGWAFIVGLILAILISIFGSFGGDWAYYILAILGLLVGLLNVTDKEVVRFLVSAIAFIVTFQSLSSIATRMPFGETLSIFFGLVNVFIAPAAAVVAIGALYSITKD